MIVPLKDGSTSPAQPALPEGQEQRPPQSPTCRAFCVTRSTSGVEHFGMVGCGGGAATAATGAGGAGGDERGTSMCSSFHLTPHESSTPPVQRVPFHAQPRLAQLASRCCRWHEPALLGTLVGGVRKWRPPCALVVPTHHASMKACSHAFSSFANCCTAKKAGSLGKAGSSQSLTLPLASMARESTSSEQPELAMAL